MNNTVFLYRALIFALLSAFILSGYLLENIGIQYVSEGGTPLLKIHLYSFIILFLTMFTLLKLGINTYLKSLGELKNAWLLSFVSIFFVIMYGFSQQGLSGMAYLVDTILSPILLVPLLLMLSLKQRKRIIVLLAWLLFINSSIAILEFIRGQNFIEAEFNFDHFRSIAMLNHPLNNALITASLSIILISQTRISPLLYFFIVVISLFAFGGRAALAIFILAIIIKSLPLMLRFTTTGVHTSMLKVSLYQFGIIILVSALAYTLMFTPIGDRILSKLEFEGSAQTRFDVYLLLGYLNFNEWFFGASKEIKDNISFFIGIDIIENYIIAWIMSFGLLGAIPLLLSSFILPLRMVKSMSLNAKITVLTFAIVSISNNALATKTPALLLLSLTLVCLYKRRN